MTLAVAAAVVAGRVPAAHEARLFERVTSDSRSAGAGDLFVAINGEHFDGHDFVVAALEKGATGALIDADRQSMFADAPCVTARDARIGLGQLASAWRARFTLPLIAVAGSNGKTTVTQMIASILRAHSGDAAFHTEGNYNNDIGLPLTILRLRGHHKVGVVELGMNHRGEIACLAAIAQPTVALVNNAQREHQEFMSSVREVAIENASLYDSLPRDGVAIVNADDEFAQLFIDRAGGHAIRTFAMDRDADVRVTIEGDAAFGSNLRLSTWQGTIGVALAIAGRHNALNAAAATAAAVAAGVPLAAVGEGLQKFLPVSGRLVKSVLANGAVVLDDTYNANPDSVRAAIDVLHRIGGRRVLVLGPMAEVGENGPAFHCEVGAYARERGIDALLTIGEAAEATANAFGATAARHQDIDALIAATRAAATVGTTVLIKGSRSARMERVVRALTGSEATEGAH